MKFVCMILIKEIKNRENQVNSGKPGAFVNINGILNTTINNKY